VQKNSDSYKLEGSQRPHISANRLQQASWAWEPRQLADAMLWMRESPCSSGTPWWICPKI